MKFSIRDLIWLTVIVGVCSAWFVDHARLKWQIALNDWAWAMHPEGGSTGTNGAGGGATFFTTTTPPAFVPVDAPTTTTAPPFSFLGEPISQSNFERKSDLNKAGDEQRLFTPTPRES